MGLLGIPFLAEPSEYEEDMTLELSPRELVIELSKGKAEFVARKHRGEECIVIGSDTFIAFEGKVFGKPKTAQKAREILLKLSGKTHSVLTGLALISSKTLETRLTVNESLVTFREISEKEIEAYIDTGEPLERAAGYAIQGRGGIFVEKIEGEYFGIVGLPLRNLVDNLRHFGISVLE